MSKHILIHMISLSVDFYYIRNICSSLYQYIHSGILQIQRLNRFLTLKIDWVVGSFFDESRQLGRKYYS